MTAKSMTRDARIRRSILALIGLAFTAIGLNTALGGMFTLGWQFSTEAANITDLEIFARHDSNARFFAGVFVAFGLVTAAGAIWFDQLRPVIIAFLLAIAVGGLFRLLQSGYSPVTDQELLPSLIAELILGPLFALWIVKSQ